MYSVAGEDSALQFDSAFFDQGVDRHGVCSIKWEAPHIKGDDVIPLWVADMDFPAAPAITRALIERAQHPSYGYTFMDEHCRQAVCDYWLRRHRVEIQPEQTSLIPSVVSGLRICVAELTKPGEGVIIMTPVYGPFFHVVSGQGRRIMEAPLKRDSEGGYSMDLEAVERQLKAGARLMLLCNPHNPVSRAWSREELEALLQLLKRYNCALCSDEIHADFVYQPQEFISLMRLDAEGLPLVTLVSASKTFNIAGLQQATIICRDKEMLDSIVKRLQAVGVEAGNIFAMVANCAAYREGDDWLDGLMAYLGKSRGLLSEQLHQLLPEAVMSPITATFLAWVDVRAYGHPNAELLHRRHLLWQGARRGLCADQLWLPTCAA